MKNSLCRSTSGFFHIPFAMVIFLVSLTGFGIWGVMKNWRNTVTLQLRLNQCVGEKALELKDHLNKIESHNIKIRALRLGVLPSVVLANPVAYQGLKIAIKGLAFMQDYERAKWKISQKKWLLLRQSRSKDIQFPLPELSFFPREMDFIGPKPLRWKGRVPDAFDIQLSHIPRSAAAAVKGGSLGATIKPKNWEANWTVPREY